MKKFLIIGILAAAAFFAVSPVWAYSPSQGDLIKVNGNSAVYYVDGMGYRHLFSTESTFFSWYAGTWKDQSVATISNYDFNLIPSAQNVTARPGYALVRFENSMVMYAVTPGRILCTAPAHYGNYQYNRALVIPVGFQNDYIANGNCDIKQSVNLPDGTLFRYINSANIYYVQNGQRRQVTASGMTANNFHSESIVNDVDWSMSFPDGAIIDGYDASISSINSYLFGYNNNNNNNSYNYNNYRGYCSENWSCNSWSTCLGGYQFRTCNDLNSCGTTASKPATGQTCYSYNFICQENWTCNSWSSCAYGSSYRTCWDQNSCGTTNSKPAVTQTCNTCQENWSCSAWGSCQTTGLSNGWQFRTCADLNGCGTYRSQPSTSQVCNTCQTNWSCTGWTACSNSLQTRSCLDLNNCNSSSGRPITSQSCR